MNPKYEDPAEIKFINKKFILATNDKKNPVQMVRQMSAGDDSNVMVSLSNGDTYKEYFDSLQDLISVTSNRAWTCTITCTFHFRAYGNNDHETVQHNLDKALTALQAFSYYPVGKYYLSENRMIPRRLTFTEFYYDLTLNAGRDGDIYTSEGVAEIQFSLIAPPETVEKITDEVREDIERTFRSHTGNMGGVSFGDRNATSEYSEDSLDEAIELMKAEEKPDKAIIVTVAEKRECYAPSTLKKIVSKLFLK